MRLRLLANRVCHERAEGGQIEFGERDYLLSVAVTEPTAGIRTLTQHYALREFRLDGPSRTALAIATSKARVSHSLQVGEEHDLSVARARIAIAWWTRSIRMGAVVT